jgi:hypothetical protein
MMQRELWRSPAQKPGCFGKAGLHLAAAVFTEGDSQVIGLLK